MTSSSPPGGRLTADDLAQFTGTEQLYFDPLFPAFKYTDGVRHLRFHDLNWLVVDILTFLPTLPPQEEFVCIVLRTTKTSRGVLSFDDGNGNVLRPVHKYQYSDCPLPELKLFFTGGVLMLPSEY